MGKPEVDDVEVAEAAKAIQHGYGCVIGNQQAKNIAYAALVGARVAKFDVERGASRVVSFDYVNYRGERSRRDVSPISLRHGTNRYHRDPQFLLRAFDINKKEIREFAIKEMSNVLDDEFLNEQYPAQRNVPIEK